MKLGLQLLLNDFIANGASVRVMYEVMDALTDVDFYRGIIERREAKDIKVYEETRERLASAERLARIILKGHGYDYSIDDLL